MWKKRALFLLLTAALVWSPWKQTAARGEGETEAQEARERREAEEEARDTLEREEAEWEAPEKNYIALTFDDGPHRGTTDRLLDGLAERDAKATFFLVGEEAAGNRDLVIRMGAEGHQVGNHTWSHSHLDELSPEEIIQEIGKTDALLQSLLGPGEYWLRPPYGLVRAGTENLIPVPVIKWSVDPRDWESRNTEKVIRAVTDTVEPGSIILLHDIYATSIEAALRLIDLLREEGYEFVTVQELLARSGITARPGVSYRNAGIWFASPHQCFSYRNCSGRLTLKSFARWRNSSGWMV